MVKRDSTKVKSIISFGDNDGVVVRPRKVIREVNTKVPVMSYISDLCFIKPVSMTMFLRRENEVC